MHVLRTLDGSPATATLSMVRYAMAQLLFCLKASQPIPIQADIGKWLSG